MKFEGYLTKLQDAEALTRAEAETFLGLMLDDDSLPESDIIAALTVLANKAVTVEEVCGFVAAMRARMIRLQAAEDAIDTCGTGGDKSGTFNISTAAAILLAAGNVKVAKHGNRAATSKCGSADVVEALGIPVDLTPAAASHTLQEQNFVFLFAPQYHPALKRLAVIRRQLGFPTVFNLLGPLLNPAGVKRQVVGTFSMANAELLAGAMATMNYQHAIVLTSNDGLDEASLAAPVNVLEIKGSEVSEWGFRAEDYGLEPAPVSALQGGDAARNSELITEALAPAKTLSVTQRIIVLNAALGFYVAGAVSNVEAGIQRATEVLTSGQASAKLRELSIRHE
jgi:anthranilate phosphoribosyltransferase